MIATVDEVLDACGGTSASAALAGVSLPAVSNWRARGRIPSEKFMIFDEALRRLGKRAPPHLFGIEPVEVRS